MGNSQIISFLKQFISYFFVGGISAVVEWTIFFILANIWKLHYITATCLAFLVSTSVNFILGRIWTFRENRQYEHKHSKEFLLVFGVSAIGLFFNLVLMYLFVSLMGLDTELLKTGSKIMATGIVFIWNFLIRKFVIYK